MKQFIPAGGVDRIPKYDPRSGDHLWTTFAVYRINPVAMTTAINEPVHLDNENLIHVGAMGCYHCEQPYHPRLLRRRCGGEPKDRQS